MEDQTSIKIQKVNSGIKIKKKIQLKRIQTYFANSQIIKTQNKLDLIKKIRIISCKKINSVHYISAPKIQTPIYCVSQIQEQNSAKKCLLCFQQTVDFYTPYQCNHQFCLNCQLRFIENQLNEHKFLQCPQQNCNAKYDSKVIVGMLSQCNRPDLIQKIDKFIIRFNYKIYQCIKCLQQYDVSGLNYAVCCNYMLCLKCNHSHHKNEACDETNIISMIRNIEYPCICPKCLSIYQKDENCNHVRCINCKIDFCALCSAYRNLIMDHDNSYHRSDCDHYSKSKRKQKNINCQLCKLKVCDRPKITYKQFVQNSFEGRYNLIEQILIKSSKKNQSKWIII